MSEFEGYKSIGYSSFYDLDLLVYQCRAEANSGRIRYWYCTYEGTLMSYPAGNYGSSSAISFSQLPATVQNKFNEVLFPDEMFADDEDRPVFDYSVNRHLGLYMIIAHTDGGKCQHEFYCSWSGRPISTQTLDELGCLFEEIEEDEVPETVLNFVKQLYPTKEEENQLDEEVLVETNHGIYRVTYWNYQVTEYYNKDGGLVRKPRLDNVNWFEPAGYVHPEVYQQIEKTLERLQKEQHDFVEVDHGVYERVDQEKTKRQIVVSVNTDDNISVVVDEECYEERLDRLSISEAEEIQTKLSWAIDSYYNRLQGD